MAAKCHGHGQPLPVDGENKTQSVVIFGVEKKLRYRQFVGKHPNTPPVLQTVQK